jgi:hypothetical protein
MKTNHTAAVLLFLTLLFSCREEEKNFSPITGKWRGTLAELRIKPLGIPIPVRRDDEDFSSLIEFGKDGTLTLTQGLETSTGTYTFSGNTITTDLQLIIEGVTIPGIYTVEDLTPTNLVFHVEKSGTFTDPSSGRSLSGDIKVTLHFQRADTPAAAIALVRLLTNAGPS